MSDNSSRINLFTSHYGLFRRVLCLCWKKVALADPTVKPKGIVLVVETGVKAIDDYMKSIMPKKFAKNYYPYFAMVFCYILVSNLSSLIGFESPTSNYSITFAMTFITFILIQYNALKKKGFLNMCGILCGPQLIF